MAAKQMLYDTDARSAMLDGAAALAAAVKVTLGPTGRNVLLQKSFGGPKVTKDGVTVSKEIELPDPFANMGAKLVNQVAAKTSDVAGDGTTTAVVLAEAIMREGLKKGDEVFYAKYAGTEVKIDAETYVILRESDVLAVLVK